MDTTALNGVWFVVADLPEGILGLYTPGLIQIDVNAAGMGWFLDPTPADDSEFAVEASAEELLAVPSSPAWGHVDQLSVIAHEMGHALGFADQSGGTPQVMDGTISTGMRRFELPEEEVRGLLADRSPSAARDVVDAAFTESGWIDSLLGAELADLRVRGRK